MPRETTSSVLGLYNWDDTIFDGLQLPAGVDRDVLLDNLLLETAELEVCYPNPQFFKTACAIWSKKQLAVWTELYATTQYDYNPIENYNRMETRTLGITGSTTQGGQDGRSSAVTAGGQDGRSNSVTLGGSDSVTSSKTDGGSDGVTNNQTTTNSGTDTTTTNQERGRHVAGFDSPSAPPAGDGTVIQTKDVDQGSQSLAHGLTQTLTGSQSVNYGKTESGTESTSYGKTETGNETTTYGRTETGSETTTYGKTENVSQSHNESSTIHGNIGVMSTQDMIRQQRDVSLFNIYDVIITDFKQRFCLLVY